MATERQADRFGTMIDALQARLDDLEAAVDEEVEQGRARIAGLVDGVEAQLRELESAVRNR